MTETKHHDHWFAVQSPTGVHIGLWDDGKTAYEVAAREGDGYTVMELVSADRASRPAAVPGWRLVPEEPTDRMMIAGGFMFAGTCPNSEVFPKVRKIWADLLAAAPAAPQASTTGAEPVAWVPEDELPESLPNAAYDALYPYSRVDVIRWFPIYAVPQAKAGTEDLVEALLSELHEIAYRNRSRDQLQEMARAAHAKHGGRS